LPAPFWVALANAGKAPAKWSQADIVSAELTRKEMRHISQNSLCEHDWKADLIASENYPRGTPINPTNTKRSVKQEILESPAARVTWFAFR